MAKPGFWQRGYVNRLRLSARWVALPLGWWRTGCFDGTAARTALRAAFWVLMPWRDAHSPLRPARRSKRGPHGLVITIDEPPRCTCGYAGGLDERRDIDRKIDRAGFIVHGAIDDALWARASPLLKHLRSEADRQFIKTHETLMREPTHYEGFGSSEDTIP